jgi:tetratricopeptide (TPR) repeat protein
VKTLVVWIPLVLATPALAPAPLEPTRVQRWIEAAQRHEPGTLDVHATSIAGWRDDDFEQVRKSLRGQLRERPEFRTLEARNALFRRGAMLHADIAILAPEQAQRFLGHATAWLTSDGSALAETVGTGHWAFARALLDRLDPGPGEDSFARDWYVATTAHQQYAYALDAAFHQLERALELFPDDFAVLFLAAAMHEAFASARFQSAVETIRPSREPRGALGRLRSRRDEPGVRGAREEREMAVRLFRRALTSDPGQVEARIRLGRVLSQLGLDGEAIEELRRARQATSEPLLQYYVELFLGETEFKAGRQDRAMAAFEKAAALYPSAQSPLLALSVLSAGRGDRAGVVRATRRLAALPADRDHETDPWWGYHRSYARDWEGRLARVRGAIGQGTP